MTNKFKFIMTDRMSLLSPLRSQFEFSVTTFVQNPDKTIDRQFYGKTAQIRSLRKQYSVFSGPQSAGTKNAIKSRLVYLQIFQNLSKLLPTLSLDERHHTAGFITNFCTGKHSGDDSKRCEWADRLVAIRGILLSGK